MTKIAADNHARMQPQALLEASEARLRAIIDAATDAIVRPTAAVTH